MGCGSVKAWVKRLELNPERQDMEKSRADAEAGMVGTGRQEEAGLKDNCSRRAGD
jgi:hypothetical protein